MRQPIGTRKSPGEKLFKDIKRATHKQYSSEKLEIIRLVEGSHLSARLTYAGRMAGGLQLAQTTLSIGQPDIDGILAEKDHGQDGRLRLKI